MKNSIKVSCGQFRPHFGDTNANLEKIKEMVEQTESDLIVFPELCTSGYEMKDREHAESLALDVEGDEVKWLKVLAAGHGTAIVLGIPEKVGDKVYNGSLLIEPNGRVSSYHKLHLFDREKNIFDPGEAAPKVVETEFGRIGMMICFEWIFPEVARVLALGGAQIICHPSNLVLTYCQKAMFARSVENGVFTMTCNRIGSESMNDRTLTFTGGSQILSNRGATLAQAATDEEEVIAVEFRPGEADNKMITDRNDVLEDRRVEMYGGIIG